MASFASSPALNAGMIIAWVLVALGAIYRYSRGDWSRLRAVLFVSIAAGWAAQSIPDVAPLLDLERAVVDWLFASLSVLFVVGLGYSVYLWRRPRTRDPDH